MANIFNAMFRKYVAKSTIVRVQYGKRGQVITAEVKVSSGDTFFDTRALEYVRRLPHQNLHHPGKFKSRRQTQWSEIRYHE
jgi:TonB family protein